MRRKALLMLAVLFAFSALLIGCSKEPASSDGDKAEGTKEGTKEETPVVDTSWQSEDITLTYASWEDAEVVDKMIEAFEEKYPNVTVEKDESINWPWTEALANAASAGDCPMYFPWRMYAVGVENEWLLDVSDFGMSTKTLSWYIQILQKQVFIMIDGWQCHLLNPSWGLRE